MKATTEIYKCAILTVIAGLLAAILWQMPPQPLTREKIRQAHMQGWQNKLPLVYVQDGSITVDNDQIPVEVQNTVPVEIEH